MFKKIIVVFIIPAFLPQVIGCYSEHWIPKEDLNTEQGDIRVFTNDMREYIGTKHHWRTKNDTLVIYNEQLNPQHEIPYNLIDEIYCNKIDGIKTAALTVSVISIVGVLVYVAITNIKLNIMPGGSFFK